MNTHHHRDLPADPAWMSAVLGFRDELAQIAATDTDQEATLNWIVQRVKRLLGCDEVCVRFSDPRARTTLGHTMAWRRERCARSWPGEVSASIMKYVIGGAQALVTSDLICDPRFPELRRVRSRVRAAMVSPLVVENEVIGVLAATETEPGRHWSAGEQWAFQAIAAHSGSAIVAVRLRDLRRKYAQLQRTKERWCRENHYAAELQRRVLPATPLTLADWTLAGCVKPAQEVGGDGFDVRKTGDGRVCFSVTDVMGKGMPAAILMIAVQALLREVCTGERCIKEAMEHLDRDITGVHNGSMITLFYGELETSSGRLLYHRAGHPCPMLRRSDGTIEQLKVGSHPLGLELDGERRIGETRISPGESLLLFSDGVIDARNSNGEFFGEERLEHLLCGARHGCPEKVVSKVMRAVTTFTKHSGHQDDMTVVVLEAPLRAVEPRSSRHAPRRGAAPRHPCGAGVLMRAAI